MVKLTLNSNIALAKVPEILLEQIVSDNTFVNPIYASNKINGRSNSGVDATIEAWGIEGDSLVLPRGYMGALLALFRKNDVTHEMIDERVSYPCVYPEALRGVNLRPYQQRAIDLALRKDQGVICSPTGSGKSIIGLEIIRLRGQKALVLVHRKEIALHWINLARELLGIEPGFIGDGEWRVGAEVTVAMVQTLSTHEKDTRNISGSFGTLILDEVHHAPAQSFFRVTGLLSGKFRYGLSATLTRADGLEELIYRAVGSSVCIISRAEVEELGATVPATVVMVETGVKPDCDSWHSFLSCIISHTERNELITNLAASSAEPVLVLTDRVGHAEKLSSMLNQAGVEHVLAHGKLDSEKRTTAMAQIKTASITIGTTSLLGEGIDVSGWSVLILASPISSEVKLLQAIGRIVRPSPGKTKAIVYDLRDDCGFAGASFNKRFTIYRKNKIWVDFKNKKAA